MLNSIVIYGDDVSSMEEIARAAVSKSNDLEIQSFNLLLVKDIADFYDNSSSLSLFSFNKVLKVQVRNKLIKYFDDDIEKFKSFLNIFKEYKQVFFLIAFDRWDKNSKTALIQSKFYNALSPAATNTHECLKLKPWQIKEMKVKVQLLAKTIELTFQGQALDMFVEIMKDSFANVHNELQKIYTYSLPNKTINTDDLNVIYFKGANVDDLISIIFRKNYSGVEYVIGHVNENHPSIYVLAIIQNRVRQVLQVKILVEEGLNAYEISKLIGVHSYRVGLMIQDSMEISADYLKKVLVDLSEVEYKAKTGSIANNLIVDDLIVRLAGKVS